VSSEILTERHVVTEPGEALAGAIAFAAKRKPSWTGT
jgi:hypothetical protein